MSLYKVAGIYKITCIADGKIYVGSSKEIKARFQRHRSRLRVGKHRNTHLQSAYNKYGEESFVFDVLEDMPGATAEQLIERETYWFGVTNCIDREIGFNRDMPGLTPTRRGKEHCWYGVKGSDHPAFGYVRTKEQEEQRVASLKEAWGDEELRDKQSASAVKRMSTDVGEKNIQKLIAAGNAKRRKLTDEIEKQIRSMHSGGEGVSRKDLAKMFSLSMSSIDKAIRGKSKIGPVSKVGQGIKELIWQDLLSGMSINKTAKRHRLSTGTVGRIRDEFNDKK